MRHLGSDGLWRSEAEAAALAKAATPANPAEALARCAARLGRTEILNSGTAGPMVYTPEHGLRAFFQQRGN